MDPQRQSSPPCETVAGRLLTPVWDEQTRGSSRGVRAGATGGEVRPKNPHNRGIFWEAASKQMK